MKKRILALLLSALMLASATACDAVPENEIEEPTGSVENTPNEENSSEDSTTDNIPTQNEPVRDVPGLGQLKLLSSRNLETVSIWKDQEGEIYIYFNEWDAYRPLKGLSSYHFLYFAPFGYESDNNIVVDSETATVVIIAQDGKYDEPTLLTYHFNRNNNLVELHAVPLNIKANSEGDTFLVNMHDTNHGYYSLTPNMWGEMDDRLGGVHKWPLFMFETTDGGKSWNQISTNTFSGTKYVQILKFVSPQVGIFSFRYRDDRDDLCDRTYLTVDGGLTWYPISQLPYPFDLKKTHSWYSEISDIEQIDDCYYLMVEVRGTLVAIENSDYSFPSEYTIVEFRFESKDLINWTLIES